MEELRSIVKKYLPKGTTLNEEVLDKCIRELLEEFVKDWKENFELQREEFAKDLDELRTYEGDDGKRYRTGTADVRSVDKLINKYSKQK